MLYFTFPAPRIVKDKPLCIRQNKSAEFGNRFLYNGNSLGFTWRGGHDRLSSLAKPWYTAFLQEIMPVEAPCQTLHNYEFQLHIREYRSLPNSALSVCQIHPLLRKSLTILGLVANRCKIIICVQSARWVTLC